MIEEHKSPHRDVELVAVDDAQLQLEVRAIAELLLDIYEYRTQTGEATKRDVQCQQLDADRPRPNMKERSQ
jgi:hypothetical protein